MILIVAPILLRYRTNPNVQGLVKGAIGLIAFPLLRPEWVFVK